MNLHPALASFPFVLLCCSVLSELLSYIWPKPFAQWSYFFCITAAIFTPLTYLSGYIGLEYADQSFVVPPAAISQHQIIAKVYLLSLVPTLTLLIIRRESSSRALRIASSAALLLTFTLATATSFLGGKLVFSHGAGVKLEATSPAGQD